jgi:stearoyl-CoA desaturase (delta-9 desaturase)
MIDQTTAAAYDGAEPFAGGGRPPAATFEGDVTGWVATHRRHHAFTDRPGDPHSPYRYGSSLTGQLRGLAYAHMGWLLRDDPTSPQRYAPDLMADRAMRAVSAAFPDISAAVIRIFERLGWATMVRWPTPARLDSRRSERIR